MNLASQITRYMSLREPQEQALSLLTGISEDLDYKTAQLSAVAAKATEKAALREPLEFDTAFASFCFALATGVGKTRLMGASIYYLWKAKGYRHFFILSPNITIYEKLKAELFPSHPKYMFTGLSDFPSPIVYDGDNYLRFNPQQIEAGDPAFIFIFNIGKIFNRTDTEFKFHAFDEDLGDSFSTVLQHLDDLVILMDESHRYRGAASLKAINHLRPALGLEFTATPSPKQKNVLYRFTLAESIRRFIKTPSVLTRTNLTTSDAEEIEKLKLLDGMNQHEKKKARLEEYCRANNLPMVKPFVLISTKDTTHAKEVRALVETESFCEGNYRGKVIEIHSGITGAESDANVQQLLTVEKPTSTVEIVIHVNMLKEGWDVKNLYTIIPLRASISEILTEQTIGRGLRLPFGIPTGDEDLDTLEIVAHDNYTRLVQAAKGNPLFRVIKQLDEDELRPVKTISVAPHHTDIEKVLDRLAEAKQSLFASHYSEREFLNQAVQELVREDIKAFEEKKALQPPATPTPGEDAQTLTFDLGQEEPAAPPEIPPDPVVLEEHYKRQLHLYAERYIDVPRISIEVMPELKIEPFEVQVTIGPFLLVDQRIVTTDLATGKDHIGDKAEVMEIDNPRGFLAAKLIDEVEEMDVAGDKEFALRMADGYLAKIDLPGDDIPKIVHLYRNAMINDMKAQIEQHLSESTHMEMNCAKNPVRFSNYSKTVLAKDGIKHYSETVVSSQIRKYLFEGFSKTIYPYVPFDSVPEKNFAAILESDPRVLKWIRPPEGSLSINHRGKSYNPDFIVETPKTKFLIEIKMMKELYPIVIPEVNDKARAAVQWAEMASTVDQNKGWEYKLIPEDAVSLNSEFGFVIGHAVRV